MKNKEVPDVLSDVSKDFIEYFKSISVQERKNAVPDEGIPDQGMPEKGIPDLNAVPDEGIPDVTIPEKGIPDKGTALKKGIPRSGTALKKGIPDQGTPIEDQSLSLALIIIETTRDFILRSEEINPTEKLVMMYLIELSLSSSYLLPTSYNEISSSISTSKSAVVRCIKALQDKGFIKYIPGTNQLSASIVDVRGTYHKVLEQHEQSIQLTDFLDFWYTLERHTSKRYSKELLLCLYVLNNKTNQHTDLILGGVPDRGIPVKSIPDRGMLDQGIPDQGTAILRASTGDSINNILWYSIARGFNSEKITAAFINYLVDSLEEVGGSYQERTDILHNFEMEYAVAIEYTKKRNAKNPWSYIITCVKNGYTSSEDTIELRREVKANIEAINKYLGSPDEVELVGLDELTALSKLFDLNLKIDAKNASNCRSKIKQKISELMEESEQVIRQFKLKFGSRSDELLKRF